MNIQETKQHMKILGTSMIALTAAAAMFVTACAEANNKARSSNEQGHQRKERAAVVTNSQEKQGSMHPEADYDFGDAAAYYNAHPDGGK
jgi:heat shock protein HslJ